MMIALLALGLSGPLLGCGTTTVEKVIIVTVTPSPSPTAPGPALTSEELDAYRFISAALPKLLTHVAGEASQAMDDAKAGRKAATEEHSLRFGKSYRSFARRWTNMGRAGGNVRRLEADFNQYMVAVFEYGYAVLRAIYKGGSGQAILDARARVYKYGPRVQEELDSIEAELGPTRALVTD